MLTNSSNIPFLIAFVKYFDSEKITNLKEEGMLKVHWFVANTILAEDVSSVFSTLIWLQEKLTLLASLDTVAQEYTPRQTPTFKIP